MSNRLTISEFEFLIKALGCLEDQGNGAVKNGSFADAAGDAITFYGADRPRIIDTVNKIRILKEKIKAQAMP